jgi:transcriptional regulator
MYLPHHFEDTDPQAVRDIIESCPLATLVVSASTGLAANHILVIADGAHAMIGHVAAANHLHRTVDDGAPVLLIFSGEDSYISPNWYPTKPQHHRHVPTWNYQVVHVHGRITFTHADKAKRAIVGRMTKHFETAVNGSKAWKMADAPSDYIAAMVDMIVGFKIDIERVSAKTKISQNRELEDFSNVASELEARGYASMSSRMQQLQTRRNSD